MTIEGVLNTTFSNDEGFFGFLNLLSSANLTFKGSQVIIDTVKQDNSELRFNSILNFAEYRVILDNAYYSAVEDIKYNVNTLTEYKSDKLYFLIDLITEIGSAKNLLQKNSQDQYRHSLFKFSNISKNVKFQGKFFDESACQVPYSWMDHYLSKMYTYLCNFKDVTEKLSPEEYPLPKSTPALANASTVESPLKFFEYFFTDGGFSKFHQEFICTPEFRDAHDLHYDPINEIITHYYQDSLTGDWLETTRSFYSIFDLKLYNEHLLSKKMIEDHLNKLFDNNSITSFLTITLIRLNYLLSEVESKSLLSKYPKCTMPILAIIRFIRNKYGHFIPNDFLPELTGINPNATYIPLISQKSLPSKKINTIYSFKLKSTEPYTLSTLLFEKLKKDSKFISENTNPQIFHQAFDGSLIEQPEKIRWTVISQNKYPNKHTLIYLLEKLAAANFIEEDIDHKTFRKQIELIFSDSNGKSIKNLGVSLSSFNPEKQKVHLSDELDAIITFLTDTLAK